MNKDIDNLHWDIGPERPIDILWVEKVFKLQLNENGLSFDINNNSQILAVILKKILKMDENRESIELLLSSILLYRERSIYINNQADFELLESHIPWLKSRIAKIDTILEFIKKSYYFENKETFIKQILVAIDQLQDILHSKSFPISRLIETRLGVEQIIQ